MKRLYGKLPARIDPRTLKLADYLPRALPPVPSSIDWSGNILNWQMLGNDQVEDCTCAAALHLDMDWCSNTRIPFAPTTADALAAYSAITGYNPANPATDQGACEIDVLNFWRQTGMAGRKIGSYASVDVTRQDHVQAAIALFGGLYIGIQVPSSADDEFESGQPWTDLADTNIEGGHAVPLVGYTEFGPTCITWGQKQLMSWAWLAARGDEGYAVFSPDWLNATGISPSNLNQPQLLADLAAVTA